MHSKFIRDAETIYYWLSDDQSKQIFINRLSWLISGEKKYIDTYKNRNSDTTYPQVRDTGAKKLMDKVRELNQPVILYGGGGIGTGVFDMLRNAGISVQCFWDRDERKQKGGVCDTLTRAPGTDYQGETVIVATGWYSEEVTENLRRIGVEAKNILIPDFTEVSLDLSHSYFDRDIIQFSNHEVFVDGGCFDFGTSQILLDRCQTVKSIYAFEPDANQWLSVEDGINKSGFGQVHFIKKGLWSEPSELRFTQTFGGESNVSEKGTVTVPVTSIDDTIHEPITFIKMDIEGAELEALKGAAHHISQERPKLAICIYHKPEDMFEIPLYIKSLVPEYRLFMRHYSNIEVETILYAI